MVPQACIDPKATLSPSSQSALAASKAALAAHPVYRSIDNLQKLRWFVQHHVACVWDFMSLLKSLQADLAPAQAPWAPPRDAEAARLINEIVLDEESDKLPYRDGYGSHFVWYLDAMEELGANVGPTREFLARLAAGSEPVAAMRAAGLPEAACEFTQTTLSFLHEPLAVRAAVFLHGREEVIPQMFQPLVASMRAQGLPCERFLLYLQRHIEVDGGAHGAHAAALLERLCAAAPEHAAAAQSAALRALAARAELWDAVLRG